MEGSFGINERKIEEFYTPDQPIFASKIARY
jgi:hypothetical protein